MPNAKSTRKVSNDEKIVTNTTKKAPVKKKPVRKPAARKASKAKPPSKKPVAVAAPDKPAHLPLVLEAGLSVANIASLVEQLLPALNTDGPVVIDATKVASVDSAALQVLVAFSNSARAQSLVVEWQGSTSALREFSELADLDSYLDLGAEPVVEESGGLCPVF